MGQLLQGITLGFTATATPGPFQAYLLNHTAQHGKGRTLPLCLAPLLSDLPIVVLMLCILTRMPPGLLRFIQILGGLFLLYLAAGALSAHWNQDGGEAEPAKPSNFRNAMLMNFLSPGAYIFWGTVTGPMFLKAWSHSAFQAMGFVGGFYATLIGGFVAFVVVSHAALSVNRKAGRVCSIVAAAVLLGFGVWQIWKGAAG